MPFNFNSLNKGKLFDFVPNANMEYKNLLHAKEIANGFKVLACYINKKSKYGDSPVVATENFFINLPKWQLDNVKAIMANQDAIKAINEGKVFIEIYDYEKGGKKYQGVNWKCNE